MDGARRRAEAFLLAGVLTAIAGLLALAGPASAQEQVNSPPEAQPQGVTAVEDTPVEITLRGSDADGDNLTFEITTPPAAGTSSAPATVDCPDPTTTLEKCARVTYTPNADVNGPDSFEFTVSDGTLTSEPATVAVTVTPVNDPPTFELTANADQTVAEDSGQQRVPGFVAKVSPGPNEEGQAVIFIVTNDDKALFSEQPEVAPDGTLTFTPAPDKNGAATVTVVAEDDAGAKSAPATFEITVTPVNDAPVATDDAATIPEDEQVTLNVLTNDRDTEGEDLDVASFDGTSTQGGTVACDAETGECTLTPAENFSGTDSFTYAATDGTGTSETATVTITVSAVNDAPVADDDAYATTEDEVLSVPAPGVLEGDDAGPEDEPLTARLESGPENGTLDLRADGSFTYTPDADFNGTDSFAYASCDGPDSCSAPATVTITVGGAQDAPTAEPQSVKTFEDSPVEITLEGSDVDGEKLTFRVTAPPTAGTLSAVGPVECVEASPPAPTTCRAKVTYTPRADFNGSDSFEFVANDGTADGRPAAVSVVVAPRSDTPAANDDSYATAEDRTLEVRAANGVLRNDVDADRDRLTAKLVSDVERGKLTLRKDGSFAYVPEPDAGYTATFEYAACDPEGNCSEAATVTIKVGAVDDAPPSFDGECDVTGTSGDDKLTGTPGDDVICGRGGDDTIEGLGGDDVLVGNRGDDVLVGGTGNDLLLGKRNRDDLDGGTGEDSLKGNRGFDTLGGADGSGGDLVDGGRARDECDADPGDEVRRCKG